jgi:hypothetical protein
MKRDSRDWTAIQEAYDAGATWRDVQTKFGVCNATLTWARQNRKLQCRTISDAQKLAWANGTQDATIYQTPEHRKKMAKFGGLKPRAGHCKHIKYTMRSGTVVDLQGTWELKFAVFLDDRKIEWERNRVGYRYTFGGKEHEYFPDFWIKELDIYVEVKGYETEKDRAKWKQFPFKLLVVKKQEIQDLTSWWNKQSYEIKKTPDSN